MRSLPMSRHREVQMKRHYLSDVTFGRALGMLPDGPSQSAMDVVCS
jgi:hypothetical protein